MAPKAPPRISPASVLILVTLLCSAYFSARAVTQLAAAAWLPPPLAEIRAVPERADAPNPDPDLPRSSRASAEAVLTRNIFDSETGSIPWEPPPPPEPEPEEIEESGPPEQPWPPDDCDTQYELVASVVLTHSLEDSFAAIAHADERRLVRVGQRLGEDESGPELVALREDLAYLRPSEEEPVCSLPMFLPAGEERAQARAERKKRIQKRREKLRKLRKKRRRNRRKSLFSKEELNEGIKKLGKDKYAVSRSLVDELMGKRTALLKRTRLVPHKRGGRMVGMRLYGVRKGGVLHTMGLRSGDVLRALNGFQLSDTEAALKAYSQLRGGNNLSLALFRRGRSRTVQYEIR